MDSPLGYYFAKDDFSFRTEHFPLFWWTPREHFSLGFSGIYSLACPQSSEQNESLPMQKVL